MEAFSERRLEDALRALRPAPDPDFAAELDRRAADGFAARSRPVVAVTSILDRARSARRARLRVVLAGAAVAAIAFATAVVSVSENRGTGTIENVARPAQGAGVAAPARRAGGKTEFSQVVPAIGSSAVGSGPLAAEAQHRSVERAAEVVLGADPQEVHEVAGQVLATVHRYDGVVLRSSVHDVGGAPSRFDLLIPSGSLGDALADISAAGAVISRHESTADVTGRAIGLGERLQDSRARVESLLGELADAESEAAREAVEAELRTARREAAGLRSRLNSLQRRIHFSRVSVLIRPDARAAAGDSGAWGLSDGVSAAGRVLATAAGVTLIALAALALPAALVLAAWLGRRAWLRRVREQALG
jgi:hypothetical protein